MTDPFPRGGPANSDLRSSVLKARFAKLPHLPALFPSAQAGSSGGGLGGLAAGDEHDEEEEEEEEGEGFGDLVDPATAAQARSHRRGPGSASSASGSSSAPAQQRTSRKRRGAALIDGDFTPLTSQDCFQTALEVDVPVTSSSAGGEGADAKSTFRVYYTAPRPHSMTSQVTPPAPSVMAKAAKDVPILRKPAGSSSDAELDSLTTPVVAEEDDEDDTAASATPPPKPGTLFVLLHGAGFSALSFALVAKHITRLTDGEAGVLAIDARGHGRTKVHREAKGAQGEKGEGKEKGLPLDMSLEQQTRDTIEVLQAMFPESETRPSLVLVGHSMGGAVVVSVAHALQAVSSAGKAFSGTAASRPAGSMGPPPSSIPSTNAVRTKPAFRISGVAVLDVVEGTAISALPSMRSIVEAMPKGFDSEQEAIRWHLESATIINPESARRSVPSLLKPNEAFVEGREEQQEVEEEEEVEELDDARGNGEGEAEDGFPSSTQRPLSSHRLIWKADLLSTEPFWRGWFEGLSKRFLEARCARLLLLAGTDRLDKELMIGQMQGKYQLVVFPDVGHQLQEDAPQKTAETLVDFWRRNEAAPIPIRGLRRVGE